MRTMRLAILAEHPDQLARLKSWARSAMSAELVGEYTALPTSNTDAELERLRQVVPDIVVVDLPPQAVRAALSSLEIIHAALPEAAIFAVGKMDQPKTIIAAMRAGACEYLDRQGSASGFQEAISHVATAGRKRRASSADRGKVFTVISAKGGSGGTTVAVNLALALQKEHGSVALVDLATLGHTTLHLNVKPNFGLQDAVRNLHRMDGSLLESLTISCPGGLRLLAGANQPGASDFEPADLARLLDFLVSHYSYVVVDCSTRVDRASRAVCDVAQAVLLVAQTDVASLWSAGRVRESLGELVDSRRVHLVLNRYRKISGFSDEDAEAATTCTVFWKIPNQFNAVGPAIDRGNPVVTQGSSEVARSFRELAAELTGNRTSLDAAAGNRGKQEPQKKILERLINLTSSPVRSGS